MHPDNHPLLKMRSPETVIPTVYRVGMTTLIDVEERGRAPTRLSTPLSYKSSSRAASPEAAPWFYSASRAQQSIPGQFPFALRTPSPALVPPPVATVGPSPPPLPPKSGMPSLSDVYDYHPLPTDSIYGGIPSAGPSYQPRYITRPPSPALSYVNSLHVPSPPIESPYKPAYIPPPPATASDPTG